MAFPKQLVWYMDGYEGFRGLFRFRRCVSWRHIRLGVTFQRWGFTGEECIPTFDYLENSQTFVIDNILDIIIFIIVVLAVAIFVVVTICVHSRS